MVPRLDHGRRRVLRGPTRVIVREDQNHRRNLVTTTTATIQGLPFRRLVCAMPSGETPAKTSSALMTKTTYRRAPPMWNRHLLARMEVAEMITSAIPLLHFRVSMRGGPSIDLLHFNLPALPLRDNRIHQLTFGTRHGSTQRPRHRR